MRSISLIGKVVRAPWHRPEEAINKITALSCNEAIYYSLDCQQAGEMRLCGATGF